MHSTNLIVGPALLGALLIVATRPPHVRVVDRAVGDPFAQGLANLDAAARAGASVAPA